MLFTPIIRQSRLEAFMARARFWLVWLIGVVARIAPLNGSRRLHAYVDRAERWIERVLFIAACARLRTPPQRTPRPRSTPTGFRRQCSCFQLFLKSARVRLRNATLAERLAHLAATLDAPERVIAHFIKRLRRRLTPSRLVLATPRPDDLPTRALESAALVDSS